MATYADNPHYQMAAGILEDLKAKGLDHQEIDIVIGRLFWIHEGDTAQDARTKAEENDRQVATSYLDQMRKAPVAIGRS